MKKTAVAAMLIALVAVGAGAGYLIGSGNSPRLITSSTTSSPSTDINTLQTTNGLQLKVSVNSTSISIGQRLGITISLYNSLPSELNLTWANAWWVHGYPVAMWSPCYHAIGSPFSFYPHRPIYHWQPVEFMIVRGNYTVKQLHILSYSTAVRAGCRYNGYVDHIIMRGRSNLADLSGVFCIALCVPLHDVRYSLVSTLSVIGYWAYPINATEEADLFSSYDYNCLNSSPPQNPCPMPTFGYPEVAPIPQHVLTAGLYTLVVSDEWGQVVIVHFSVVNTG